MSNQSSDSQHQPTADKKESGGISFGEHATVEGDVFTGNKYLKADVIGGNQYIGTTDATKDKFSQEELLKLLTELKSCIKQAPFDEDDKDVAVGQVATAIQEAKKTNQDNQKEQKNKIGKYLNETKTILDRVKDIGEIGEKAFPTLVRLAEILSVSLF
ncbi:MAG: hypothetical protein F6K31_26265 [Symploca sp. SIO2G7]|nr:hypothetical protein [Symploca sp. SIO2G7]